MNKVILIGRLTRDPEVRYTQTGKSVASFTLAVDRNFSRQSQDGQTADFIPIVAWERRAEFAKNYLTKGRQILVEGRMQVRSFEGRDGSKRYTTEVIVENFEFVGSKSQAQQGGGGGNYYSAPPAPSTSPAPSASAQSSPSTSTPEAFGPSIPEEDIPF